VFYSMFAKTAALLVAQLALAWLACDLAVRQYRLWSYRDDDEFARIRTADGEINVVAIATRYDHDEEEYDYGTHTFYSSKLLLVAAVAFILQSTYGASHVLVGIAAVVLHTVAAGAFVGSRLMKANENQGVRAVGVMAMFAAIALIGAAAIQPEVGRTAQAMAGTLSAALLVAIVALFVRIRDVEVTVLTVGFSALFAGWCFYCLYSLELAAALGQVNTWEQAFGFTIDANIAFYSPILWTISLWWMCAGGD